MTFDDKSRSGEVGCEKKVVRFPPNYQKHFAWIEKKKLGLIHGVSIKITLKSSFLSVFRSSCTRKSMETPI